MHFCPTSFPTSGLFRWALKLCASFERQRGKGKKENTKRARERNTFGKSQWWFQINPWVFISPPCGFINTYGQRRQTSRPWIKCNLVLLCSVSCSRKPHLSAQVKKRVVLILAVVHWALSSCPTSCYALCTHHFTQSSQHNYETDV